ncbi:16S rRNA (uracil(1498)-N(3))-methyltransferase [Nitratiruptor sp. SB155-2]|uniref:16S rRNA (uracil(1498)-N(3))-methyltransferase n=1 Tax=Nitratiruptor sp. (strain SB155-2) TaxID=387092 RepID=UPI0001587288|nr:16S rRNA (uracil(1498)-N(3))-methyltransferase [Nitratiruptor sp. SB155-2]BAF70681.1 conserved hypothetical protein [Nitratiruptor sp. SB155-2]
MQFVYHPKAGVQTLQIEGETYNYIFKVRRHRKGETIAIRNMEDGTLYWYEIVEVSRREAVLELRKSEKKEVEPKRFFHLIWCIVDPKTVEKTLPMLNEIGVSKITFVYCDRSQKNFKLKLEKLRKILINSSQQCGRSRLMELEILLSLDEVIKKYNDIVLVDFCEEKLSCTDNVERVLIGPEGGVTKEERALFEKVKGLDTPMVLRSETAAVATASKVMI